MTTGVVGDRWRLGDNWCSGWRLGDNWCSGWRLGDNWCQGLWVTTGAVGGG